MGLVKGMPICPRNRHCVEWAQIYMKYCLCSVKDGMSFTLGLVSVISWGIAEVPQIITNYKEKSTEGLSIAFLMTWIVGDLFNLFGCILEPATLPTQYYMAMLYTATTVILAAQTIYYGHISRLTNANKGSKYHQSATTAKNEQNGSIADFEAQDDQINGSLVSVEGLHQASSPIPVTATVLHHGCHGRDLYYISARSLSKSHTPTAGSYLAHSWELMREHPIFIPSQNSMDEPLISERISVQSAPPLNIKSMLCVFSALMFFLRSFNFILSVNNEFNAVIRKPPRGIIIRVGRKLLQSDNGSLFNFARGKSSGIGTFLGWTMASIYMGGRLPQICLNIRRGNVEGLNSLMFMFALVGNLTYVASILVSSLDWLKIRPNLPWLVDAGGCVILDSFRYAVPSKSFILYTVGREESRPFLQMALSYLQSLRYCRISPASIKDGTVVFLAMDVLEFIEIKSTCGGVSLTSMDELWHSGFFREGGMILVGA